MKISKTIKLIAAGMLFASPLLWSSCADTWGEHYDVTEGGMADQPSLLQNLSADPDLANFYKTLVAIGAGDMLNSSQQFTIWAPINFSAAQADSVIAVYNAQKEAGFKQEDNKAITQFLYNHTAMYSRPISSVTNDTVRMMNDKYMHLIGTSASSGSLNTNPFNEMITCNNGIIYKTAYMQNFFPNVREYIEQTAGLDSVLAYIRTYDEYELDETASVPGGVVDGKTVYLDSVTYLHNNFLSRLDAQISREDSNYTVIVPTNEVWKAKYEKIREYYRYYSPDPETLPQSNDLSSAENYCKNVLLQSCFFNTSESSKYNKNPKDSLCNTMYYERQQHWPRRNVLYNTGDLLADMEMQECKW
ncbi:MAG: hypothetical protein HUK02_05870, partial [Bacteroidaceae bacterium]|nr:hypothetical protein [Bacteroidaceae bacterium]